MIIFSFLLFINSTIEDKVVVFPAPVLPAIKIRPFLFSISLSTITGNPKADGIPDSVGINLKVPSTLPICICKLTLNLIFSL